MKAWRALIAELVGTFLLTFVDAGLASIGPLISSRIAYFDRIIAPAMVVMTMIFAIGKVSGAHINPAVTFAFVLRGDFPLRKALGYICMQIAGAVIAGTVVIAAFDATQLGLTVPHTTTKLACVLECLATLFLVYTILSTATQTSLKGPDAAFPVGFTLVFCGLIAKDLTGASMNPARSLGTAAAATYFQDLWIYIIMPLVGSALAVTLVWLTHGRPNSEEEKKAEG